FVLYALGFGFHRSFLPWLFKDRYGVFQERCFPLPDHVRMNAGGDCDFLERFLAAEGLQAIFALKALS
ncbi:MAG: hypothetical protein LBO04_05955, partial [Spirochaetaceae bacterium]|nr:hypothetical protein [Spirochaetaceae bacterium]